MTKNTVTLTWEPPKNDGGSPIKHYVVERLSWDTSGKEKETWKQCNKRDVEELSFVVEDLKEVGPRVFFPFWGTACAFVLRWTECHEHAVTVSCLFSFSGRRVRVPSQSCERGRTQSTLGHRWTAHHQGPDL